MLYHVRFGNSPIWNWFLFFRVIPPFRVSSLGKQHTYLPYLHTSIRRKETTVRYDLRIQAMSR